jgi:RimJ/RimL family protein N-acetyltransferase
MPVSPTLVGQRVQLDAVHPRDKYAVYEHCQDAVIQSMCANVPSPYRLKDADHFVGDYAESASAGGDVTLWALRSPGGGKLRGVIELRHEPVGGAELGFWIASESRRAGLMTEALSLVLDHALSSGIRRVAWEASAGNIASAIVARRSGFTFEGVARLGEVIRTDRVDLWRGAFIAGDSREPKSGWPAEVASV